MDAQYKRRYRRTGTKLDIRYGVKLGYQISNFTGDDNLIEFDSDNKHIYPPVTYRSFNSFHGGAYMDIRVTERFIFQPEIQYIVMGSEMIRDVDLNNPEQNFIVTPSTAPLSIIEVPIERRLSYVQFPLIAKIGFNRNVHLNLGPVISFKINEENVYGDVPDSLVTILNFTDPSAPDLFKGMDYGAILGLSYQMDNGLNFGIRYNRNFNNINKNEGLDILGIEPENGTTSILFNMGYTFQYGYRLRESIGRRY
jgi:hypothetical protein